MHINLNRSSDALTELENIHLQQCPQCREELECLHQLYESAQLITLVKPQEFNWQAIQKKNLANKQTRLKPKGKLFLYQQIGAIAASTFFIAVGWLVWNNHQLQGQLEQVLLVNQSLEKQIENPQSYTYKQVYFVNKIKGVDEQLFDSKSTEQKVILLKKRTEFILELYKIQKGESNVFSI